MSGFSFDAKAALLRAKKCQTRPTLPTLPTNEGGDLGKVGAVGTVGTVRAFDPEMTPEELARDLYEERAAIREYDGGQDRAEAEAAAWQEAMRAAGITALDEWRQGSDGNRHRQRSRKMEGG